MSAGVLYVSYSGMLEPLGQSQVLAYQEQLATGHSVHLISFERANDWARTEEREAIAKRMSAAGIHWHPLRYHKRFSLLTTFWDILCGAMLGWRLVRRHGLGIVHARSYVASVMALVVKHLTGASYVFDMRGFWADERVDGGLWPPDGRRYKSAKWFEKQFLQQADHVVALTHATVRELRKFDYLRDSMPRVTVIPTCADLLRFHPSRVKPVGFVLGYVGSVGTWYLFDSVVESFRQLLELRPIARLLVISRSDPDYIMSRLAAGNVPLDAVEVRAASHAEVPRQMARMHAGIFFYKPSYSRAACAPTKLGEFLGCGIPCLSNTGVGDMAEILEEFRVGVALDSFEQNSMKAGLAKLVALVDDETTAQRCVAAAQANFSLDEGVRLYRGVYESLER